MSGSITAKVFRRGLTKAQEIELAVEAKSLVANRDDVTAATIARKDPLWWKTELKPLPERLEEASRRKVRR